MERPGFYEEGGTRCEAHYVTRYGYAKLVCSQDGKPKAPIMVFPIRIFKSKKIHMKSMLFYVKKSDYLVTVAWATPNLVKNREGYVRINIFQKNAFPIHLKHVKKVCYVKVLKIFFFSCCKTGSI
jgi:hypothetical protein